MAKIYVAEYPGLATTDQSDSFRFLLCRRRWNTRSLCRPAQAALPSDSVNDEVCRNQHRYDLFDCHRSYCGRIGGLTNQRLQPMNGSSAVCRSNSNLLGRVFILTLTTAYSIFTTSNV